MWSIYISLNISIYSYVEMKWVEFNQSYWLRILYDMNNSLTQWPIHVLVSLHISAHNSLRYVCSLQRDSVAARLRSGYHRRLTTKKVQRSNPDQGLSLCSVQRFFSLSFSKTINLWVVHFGGWQGGADPHNPDVVFNTDFLWLEIPAIIVIGITWDRYLVDV